MNTHSSHVLELFPNLRVLVIGEAILDSYLAGAAGRLCSEAPVPVVDVQTHSDVPGGAANTAANIHSMGAHVALLSVIGDDDEGARLRAAIAARGIAPDHLLVRSARRTLAKHRVMAASQLLVRFDQGSTNAVDEVTERALIDRLCELWRWCDAVIVSDYCYGILTPRIIQAIGQRQEQAPRLLVLDSHNLPAYRAVGATVVKPNYAETVRLLGLPALDEARLEQLYLHGAATLELTGAQIAAVTLDSDGALIFEQQKPVYRTYARRATKAHPSGAGDTFVSALTLALAAGASTPAAAEIASAAASIVIQQENTAVCTLTELMGHITPVDIYISDRRTLTGRLALYRGRRHRIVFTNGCFDILHRGHVTFLSQAKALGDVLIVGINTDESVQRLKGPNRPINPLEDRVQVLAALSCVDNIVDFSEDTPIDLIEQVRPDVFVKGGDYTREQLPEAAHVERYGGTVHILPYLTDRSTTSVIERIQMDAATTLREKYVGG
ncbi:MAG: D-glycero-beta-D-manno-heptose 1-phosphate adenylyltransferase [Chloroflexaceae bacterium]|nr:D-glycero-beta-D-manno-heptose 1-phosphate adenylyltransferase [Chloroflexaceae bacterium]